VNIAYCQNDDMAFGALAAIKNAGRKNVLVGGCDGMPDAIKAVQDGEMTSTQRHSSCQIHSLPVILGVAWKLGAIKDFPSLTPVVAPVVTKENAAAVAFMQQEGIRYA
jgi:ABC-type sugar transport system substrate-binding protein